MTPSHTRYAAPASRSQSNHQPMVAMIELRPTTSVAIMRASPIWVPATLSSPARAPWARLLAMMTVTVGPGTMAMSTQAST